MSKISDIQTILGVAPDGIFGLKSRAALEALIAVSGETSDHPGAHKVLASSFADPADVASFKRCKAKGGTDQQCFKVGDNGIGRWGDDTTTDVPMCALPPEDWDALPTPRGMKVLVICGDKRVVCELRDTMPHRANIKNGAGIDLNEAAWKVLGHKPPVLLPAVWLWV